MHAIMDWLNEQHNNGQGQRQQIDLCAKPIPDAGLVNDIYMFIRFLFWNI